MIRWGGSAGSGEVVLLRGCSRMMLVLSVDTDGHDATGAACVGLPACCVWGAAGGLLSQCDIVCSLRGLRELHDKVREWWATAARLLQSLT
jgi:hypothetical protein